MAPSTAGQTGIWLTPATPLRVSSRAVPGMRIETPTKDSLKAMTAAMGRHQKGWARAASRTSRNRS